MKRLLLVMISVLALTFCAWAQKTDDPPATKDDVQRYLRIIRSPELIGKVHDAMVQPMYQLVRQEYLTHKDNLPADYQAQMTRRIDEIFQKMPFDEMVEAMIPAYQKRFTKGDITALVTFYSSPTGQKMLREMPNVMADTMQSVMPIVNKYFETMKEQLRQETAKSLQQAGPKPR